MSGCDYMCGRKATRTIGITNICSVCDAADKKVPFDTEVSFFNAWHAYDSGYDIKSVVSGYIKHKRQKNSNRTLEYEILFSQHEIRGKWVILRKEGE